MPLTFEADQFEALVRDTLGRHGLRAAAQEAWEQAEYAAGTRTAWWAA